MLILVNYIASNLPRKHNFQFSTADFFKVNLLYRSICLKPFNKWTNFLYLTQNLNSKKIFNRFFFVLRPLKSTVHPCSCMVILLCLLQCNAMAWRHFVLGLQSWSMYSMVCFPIFILSFNLCTNLIYKQLVSLVNVCHKLKMYTYIYSGFLRKTYPKLYLTSLGMSGHIKLYWRTWKVSFNHMK